MLLALLQALKRKDKPFAYFETHAGRGAYDLAHSAEAMHGSRRFADGDYRAPELRAFEALLRDFRSARSAPEAYPGSPCIAALQLRSQDRAVLCECMAGEAAALARELQQHRNLRVERDDGFERLQAWLPPAERRGLVFIDPPYEQSRGDFDAGHRCSQRCPAALRHRNLRHLVSDQGRAAGTRLAGGVRTGCALSDHRRRAVAVSAGLRGGAERIGHAHRQSSVPACRTGQPVAARAAAATRCWSPAAARCCARSHPRGDPEHVPRHNASMSADRYGVVGHPVSHSWSPFIHGLFARETGQAHQLPAV